MNDKIISGENYQIEKPYTVLDSVESLFKKLSVLPSWMLFSERKKHYVCNQCENKAYGVKTVYAEANCYCGGTYHNVP